MNSFQSVSSLQPFLNLLSPAHWNIILQNLLVQPNCQRSKVVQNSLSRHLPAPCHLLQEVRPGGGGAGSQEVPDSRNIIYIARFSLHYLLQSLAC